MQLRPCFTPAVGLGLDLGKQFLSSSPIMAWHQHLDCRLLLLLSKAVLEGDGFLIEIQSIGTEACRGHSVSALLGKLPWVGEEGWKEGAGDKGPALTLRLVGIGWYPWYP